VKTDTTAINIKVSPAAQLHITPSSGIQANEMRTADPTQARAKATDLIPRVSLPSDLALDLNTTKRTIVTPVQSTCNPEWMISATLFSSSKNGYDGIIRRRAVPRYSGYKVS